MDDYETPRFMGLSRARTWPFDRLAGQGLAFMSSCPPLVTVDTIIIAVCGANDFDNNASPQKDGWMFSDFYLFHHLLKRTAKQQYWMTCEDPRQLVDKYKHFSHGDSRGQIRRTVLDASLLDDVKDVMVYSRNELLTRFLSHVANISKLAKNDNTPIMIMMFGYGGIDCDSIAIGGSSAVRECPVLTKPIFREALLQHNPKPNFALFTSSRYSAGWAQTPYPNVSEMLDRYSEYRELVTWPVTDVDGTLGRCCSSKYAVGVAEALFHKWLLLDISSEEHQKIRSTSEYESFVSEVQEILKFKIDDKFGYSVSFDPQDDLWGNEYRNQSGFPLTDYRKKYSELYLDLNPHPANRGYTEMIQFSEKIIVSQEQAYHRLKRLAFEYLDSHPGPDTASENRTTHELCRRILRGYSLSLLELRQFSSTLRYRLHTIIDQATEYKEHIGLNFPDCKNFDSEEYEARSQKNRDEKMEERRLTIAKMVKAKHLFDDAAPHEGKPYDKGARYLTWALATSSWNDVEIDIKLKHLHQLHRKCLHLLHSFCINLTPDHLLYAGGHYLPFHTRTRNYP